MERRESKLLGWHSCRTEDASRASISAPDLQRKMLKATPTRESTQNPGMLCPHSTLGQTELKGRGGWGALESKPSMLSTGLQMGSRCPGPLTLRLARKGNIPLPAAGSAQPTTPREPWGRCLTIWAAHCQGRLPGSGKDREEGPLNSAWVLACKRARVDQHPPHHVTKTRHLQLGTAY